MPSSNNEKNRQYQEAFRSRMSIRDREEYDKKRYKKYKKKQNANSKQWAKDNPEKSQASSHQTRIKTKYPEIFENTDILTKDLSEWLISNKDSKCPYCGDKSNHIDHKQPLSREGTHTWSNIEMVCKTCNIGKNNQTKEEYLEWIQRLIKNN